MRTIITCMVVIGCFVSAYACDICGSGAGNTQLGILPNYLRHFAGVRYRYSSFNSVHRNDINTTAQDFFHTAELFGRYVPHKRLQIFGFVPFNHTQRIERNSLQELQALGDISVLATFIVLSNSDSINVAWKQALQIGGGLKLPTGAYDLRQNGRTLPIGLQPGSGSTDLIFNILYTLRYKKLGFNLDANYRYNTVNPNEYLQGNRLGCAARFFYWQRIKTITLLPHIGAAYEYAAQDLQYNRYTVAETGGTAFLAHVGIDVFYKQFAFGVQAQLPMYQNLNSGSTQGGNRIAAQVLYLFSKN